VTICALGFGLLAISDLTKPLSQSRDPQAGLVFFGTKLTGIADLVIAPLFAAFLAIYAVGIWRMKRYALPMSYTAMKGGPPLSIASWCFITKSNKLMNA
jgi:hypothetical protein